jgi:IS4 transposase
MRFTPGTILVFDRGYQSYKWFAELTGQGVFFVTRLRDFSRVEILKPHSRPNDPAIQSDQVVRIGSQRYRMKEDLRLVTVTGADGESVLFVTNIWHLAASTISAIYRDRWQIEVFFRALKQNLRVKSFVGTSQNAVQIQIWTAIIALLLIKYLQLRSSFGWSLSNPVALLRQQLLVYRDLWTWLDEPFEPPPQPVPVPHIQLLLALG